MELPLFDQVNDLVRAMAPEDLNGLRSRAHRRGVKVWFDSEKPGREHYEAQLLARRHVDGVDGTALEIGFHAEHSSEKDNEHVLARLVAEDSWRTSLGTEAQVATFFGAENWRRVSEAWVEPDLDDPDLAFEVGSRLVDYLIALEPVFSPKRDQP